MKRSSGVLMYRKHKGRIEFLLLRPGGPFYKNQSKGIWTIPKGIIQNGENEITAAKREFEEETGQKLITELIYLGEEKIRKGKRVVVYMTEGNLKVTNIKSNTFQLEYPKNSGKFCLFPEIESGEWFDYETAKIQIHPKLIIFLDKCLASQETIK